MSTEIKNGLIELGFKPNEIKVYLAATQLGEASAAQIAKKVNLPRTTVISILQKLAENHFLSTHSYHGSNYYWVESPRLIKESLENKLIIAADLEKALSDLYRSEAHFPYAKIYDTKESIKKYIEKTLLSLHKKSTIYTIDNTAEGNYRKIFSEDYGKILINIKSKKQVKTNTLISYATYKKIDSNKITSQNITVKELPPEINFTASFWIIENRVVFFSGKLPFLVEIDHKLIAESMKSIFDFLWRLSTPKN